jgi:hypothetical protein
MKNNTIAKIEHTDEGNQPEFLRTADVQKRFGIKRGTLYNLLSEKKVKSSCVRQKGNVTGIRLWNTQSIRDLIHSQMD